MVIELLPALTLRIRSAAIANENASPVESVPPVAPSVPPVEPVEAPERPPGPPLVRALRRRPGARYATAGNVILPLAFAERMPGWRTQSARRT